MPTISQGLAKVVFHGSGFRWYRVTRRSTDSILRYFTALPNFHYLKLYEFHGAKKPKYSPQRYCGKQIGYIYLNQKLQDFVYVEL